MRKMAKNYRMKFNTEKWKVTYLGNKNKTWVYHRRNLI